MFSGTNNSNADQSNPNADSSVRSPRTKYPRANKGVYTFKQRKSHDGEEESGYESEGETKYVPAKKLTSKGKSVHVRELIAKDHEQQYVVLSPADQKHSVSQEQQNAAIRKRGFFQAVYPTNKSNLTMLTLPNTTAIATFRLILPKLPGQQYSTIKKPNNEQKQIDLIISAIDALQKCHDAGYIVIDLKPDNILFDSTSGISYVISGGISARKQTAITDKFEIKISDLEQSKKRYPHIAPECWHDQSLSESIPATVEMDIYSLGKMMSQVIPNMTPAVKKILENCTDENPSKRPTLHALKMQLVNHKTLIASLSVNPEKPIAPASMNRKQSISPSFIKKSISPSFLERNKSNIAAIIGVGSILLGIAVATLVMTTPVGLAIGLAGMGTAIVGATLSGVTVGGLLASVGVGLAIPFVSGTFGGLGLWLYEKATEKATQKQQPNIQLTNSTTSKISNVTGIPEKLSCAPQENNITQVNTQHHDSLKKQPTVEQKSTNLHEETRTLKRK